MRQISKRLQPGKDLKQEIISICEVENIQAGVILSLVGSLTKLNIRVADGVTEKTIEEKFEIVSATGTVSKNGSHVHISVADQEARVFGGHLKNGCIVGTTVELVILAFDDVEYYREPDSQTGYNELVIK